MIVPGSKRLTWSETTLAGIAGAGVGATIVNAATPTATTGFAPGTAMGLFVGSLLVLAVVNVLMNVFDWRQPTASRLPTVELLAAGENHTVEFKQTARWNVHTEQRDPKMEVVIAKTVAGFLNAAGGTLLIGVADDGSLVGLDHDLSVMKAPDLDRYELWISDHLERCLGKPAVAQVRVVFDLVAKSHVCRLDIASSPDPVFLDTPGGERGADMWVRMGNSTRKLRTDEAIEYSRNRWS